MAGGVPAIDRVGGDAETGLSSGIPGSRTGSFAAATGGGGGSTGDGTPGLIWEPEAVPASRAITGIPGFGKGEACGAGREVPAVTTPEVESENGPERKNKPHATAAAIPAVIKAGLERNHDFPGATRRADRPAAGIPVVETDAPVEPAATTRMPAGEEKTAARCAEVSWCLSTGSPFSAPRRRSAVSRKACDSDRLCGFFPRASSNALKSSGGASPKTAAVKSG